MSTNKSFSSETSERYSRALFEVANETNELDKIEKKALDNAKSARDTSWMQYRKPIDQDLNDEEDSYDDQDFHDEEDSYDDQDLDDEEDGVCGAGWFYEMIDEDGDGIPESEHFVEGNDCGDDWHDDSGDGDGDGDGDGADPR